MLELKHILAIEDDPEILSFKTPKHGLSIWLLVRLYYIRLIESDLLYSEAPLVSTSDKPFTRKAAVSVFKSAKHNFFHAPKQNTPILIRTTGASLINRNGLLFNKLSEYFSSFRSQQSLVLEDLFDWHYPAARANNSLIYNTPWRVVDQAKAKVIAKLSKRKECSLFDWLKGRSEKLLNWRLKPDQEFWFRQFIEHNIVAADLWYDRYHAMLVNRGVKLLIAEEAAYGGWLGCLVAAAKDLGLPTAEYQHGMLASGNEVYNLGSSLLSQPELRRCAPDFFLTYGSWWGSQINLPVQQVVIGNPHRAGIVEKYRAVEHHDRWILFLGDGRETHSNLQIARSVQALLGTRYEVVFRPHPQERQKIADSRTEYESYGIEIDSNTDIYDSFSNSYAVISELSTGLFESVGLVKKAIVWETPKSKFVMPTHPFGKFKTASEAAEVILSELNENENAKLSEAIWAPHWQVNYQNFLKSVGL